MLRPLRLRWLDNKEMEKIHADTLDVLWESGVKIDHSDVISMLADAGAKIEITSGMVRLPPDLVERAIENVPGQLVFGGRMRDNDLVIDETSLPVTRSVNGVEGYQDLGSGRYRPGTQKDIVEFTRLIDGLEHPQICCSMLPSDAPHLKARDLTTVKLMMLNTVKHLGISVDDINQFKAMIEMAAVIRGGYDELKNRPLFTVLTSVTSPRTLLDYCIENVLFAGKHGIPVMVNSSPLMGATSPITIAGCLIQCNVEILSLITVSQIANPGSPVIYRQLPMAVDMATGSPVAGSIECAMATGALAQLVREKYHLHVDAFGMTTDAVTGDAQAQIERNTLCLLAALSGASILAGAGELGDGMSMDPVQLVIDNEIYSSVLRCLRGFDANAETCTKDLIKKVMPGMEFMTEQHTLEHFRTEHRRSKVFVHQSRQEWIADGSRDASRRAREFAAQLIANHRVPPLDAHTTAEVEKIYEHFLKSCAKRK